MGGKQNRQERRVEGRVDKEVGECQTHSRDEGQFEVVSSCNTRHRHLNVEEDGRHDDVIHVTLMAWEKHQRHPMLSRRGEEIQMYVGVC